GRPAKERPRRSPQTVDRGGRIFRPPRSLSRSRHRRPTNQTKDHRPGGADSRSATVGNRRTLLAAAAILLAAVAGLGVYFYVSGADDRAENKVETVEAFVAVGDIPKGTTGASAIAQGLIAPARTLRCSVPPAAVTDASLLEGKVAASTIQARQFITDASFVAPSEGGGGTLAASIG